MKIIRFITIATLAILSVSCAKTGTGSFVGSYTYKTSGRVGVIQELSILPSSDTTFYNLETEQGQMNIVKDNSSDKIVITWNDLLGEASHTTAIVSGEEFTMDSGKKMIESTLWDYPVSINFAGKGEKYGNMIIIPMQYSGTFSVAGVSMKIVSTEVECVAKANE